MPICLSPIQANTTLTVWVKRGVCGADSLINIALCCLGFLPGLLHAWYIILQNPDPHSQAYEGVQDRERGNDGSVTYYYVSRGQPQHPAAGRQGQAQGQAQAQAPTSYGTVGGNQPSGGQFPGQQNGGIPGGKTVYAQRGAAQGHGVDGCRGGVIVDSAAEGASAGASGEPSAPPPSYADAVKGDHKVQRP
jgi:uncharacterized membrane protein YqaE (UPF0057 family)